VVCVHVCFLMCGFVCVPGFCEVLLCIRGFCNVRLLCVGSLIG